MWWEGVRRRRARLEAAWEFCVGVALCNVLRAVPVVGDDGDDEDAVDGGGVGGLTEEGFERGVIAELEDAGVADDLEAGLVRVIHEEESHTIVGGEVAGGDVLLVSGEVREGKGAAVEDMEEAGGAAAMLDVGPAVRCDGGEIEAVAGGDELLLEVAEGFVARAQCGETLVLGLGAVLLLQAPGGGGRTSSSRTCFPWWPPGIRVLGPGKDAVAMR